MSQLMPRIVLVFCFLLVALPASAVSFIDIWEYRVKGNSLLDKALIQQRLKPYLGVARTLEDVEQAAATLQALYKDAGYPAVFVEIPPQTVLGGVFELQVTETRLRRIRVTGAEYFLPSLVRRSIPSVAQGRVLNLPELKEDIKYANALNQNLKIIPMLKQGPTPDTVDLELNVADEFPLTGGIEINNYHTATTTPTRLAFDLGYANLWQKNHSWSMQYQTTPEDRDEIEVLATNYILPVGLAGDKLAFYAIKSDSQINTPSDLGTITVVGDGVIAGGRYITPFFQDDDGLHTLVLGADYKDFEELVEGAPKDISYLSLTAQYSAFRRAEAWSDSLSLALTFGIRGLFNDNEEFGGKTKFAEPNFAVLKVEYERTVPFGEGWQWQGSLKGQLTDVALVSNEDLSAGGSTSVRGYYESQVSGDNGVIARTHLRAPDLSPAEMNWFNSWHPSVFLEGASLTQKDTAAEEKSHFDIWSAGLAAEARLFRKVTTEMHAGFALRDANTVQAGDVRIRGRIRYEF